MNLTILYPIARTAALLVAFDNANASPNNYISTSASGVITEIDHGGDYAGSHPVISIDMATQAELDTVVSRLDAEDMRLHSGEVVGDDLILTVGDYAASRGRNEVYTKQVSVDVSSLRGKSGADGINGANGLHGNDGLNGTNGTDGTDGVNGVDGSNGLHGNDGLDGSNGADGADGIDGANGVNGADGSHGLNGTNGAKGDRGLTGSDGVAGTNGTNGVDGLNGSDGTNGTDGADGVDGKDGANGLRGERGLQGASYDRTTLLDLRSGIASSIAATHAIRSDDGLRVGFGAYHGQAAVAIGGRKDKTTFTFSITSRKQVSVGFGMDL